MPMNKNRRAQSPKRINRHDSALSEKGRYSKSQRAPRYSRTDERDALMSGRYERLVD